MTRRSPESGRPGLAEQIATFQAGGIEHPTAQEDR